MNKVLNKLFSLFGYKLISGNALDKLTYLGKHKPHKLANDVVTAQELKKSLLQGKKEPTIVDVGAYIGQTADEYLSLFPDANILAFEPTLISYAQLEKKFKNHPQVKCFNHAITNVNGEISFYANEFSPTNSSLPIDKNASKHWGDDLLNTVEKLTVESKTLDEVCIKQNIKEIDLLKLDVQGAELQVLEGAEQLLDEKKIVMVYLEVIFVPTYAGQSTYVDIGKYLSSKGYNIYGIFNLTYDKRLKQADVLFFRG